MASSSSWIPKEGRYPVNIGTSLGRAIKQRRSKGSPAATTKRSNLPEREFYSFKFGFKASSIDSTKPATIEIKKGTESNQVTAEYPSTQPGEVHIFTGQEQRTKEVECVLIFDEETGVFTLEKIDASVHFKFDRKQNVSHENSPAPAVTPASSSSSKGKSKQEEYEEEPDADGEIDDFEDILPTKAPLRREEEEEEEGEEIEVPLRQVVVPKRQPPKAVSHPVKPTPKTRPETKVETKVEPTPPPAVKSKVQPPPPQVQPQPQSKPPPQPQPQVKPPLPASLPPKPKPATVPAPTPPASRNVKRKSAPAPAPTPAAPTPKEEVIEFGKPAKRPRPSLPSKPPPAPAPASPLSLPGASSTFSLPPAPATAKASTSRVPPPSAPSPQQVDSEDDDEDWEAVVEFNPSVPQSQPKADEDLERAFEDEMEEEIFGDGFATNDDGDADMEMVEVDPADDGEDINEDLFEAELNAELQQESEDDFLAGAISPVPGSSNKVPLSMESLAAGANGGNIFTDEEYSSSDDSDED